MQTDSFQRSQTEKRRGLRPLDIERLVQEARNLVPFMARRYVRRGVAFEDLVGAGNVGVVEAAHRFDPDRGVKFGTYAALWIRKAIVESLQSGISAVTVPRYSAERRRRVMEAITHGRSSGKRDLSPNEVAAGLGLSTRQAERAVALSMGVVSMDAPVSADSNHKWSDRLARPAEEGPEAIAMDADRARAAREALKVLSPRQRLVVMLRYGGDNEDGTPASLNDVGRVMGLSRERIRQLEGEALEAVRRELARRARKRSRG